MRLNHLTVLRRADVEGALVLVINTLGLELLASLVTTAAGRTAGAELDDKGNKTEPGADPHERQHLGTDMGLDVETGVSSGKDVGENLEHNGSHCGCHDGDQGGEEADE